jgi:hypothetical protein
MTTMDERSEWSLACPERGRMGATYEIQTVPLPFAVTPGDCLVLIVPYVLWRCFQSGL